LELNIFLNSIVFVLKASKLSLSPIFDILEIELLLEFPIESIPSGDGVGSSLDMAPTMPPNKGNAFK